MTEHIIELNDRNVSLRNRDEVFVQSPGFANIAGKAPVFGEEARRIARLHPRQTFNQFWSQLSLDPLANSNSQFRHQADLAFAHLNDIAGRHTLQDEVIFAVPSNYNRNQLGILLGLVQSCEFDAAGLVDLPLLMSADAESPATTVFLDIQLHQSVLTTFTVQDGRIVRNKVVQIPGTGLLALHDAWANMITDEFIRQSRFDPQHNAETEQYVYNQLEHWLDASLQDNEILMEINNKGTVYQARINRGYFEQRGKNIFTRIRAELETLLGNTYSIRVHEDLARLPGLSLYLDNICTVADEQALEHCLLHIDRIRGEPGALSLVTGLPSAGAAVSPAPSAQSAAAGTAPSHILINHTAYGLPAGRLTLGPVNGARPAEGSFIEVSDTDIAGVITLTRTPAGIQLEHTDENRIQLNGRKASSPALLKTGDRISIEGSGTTLQLIQVR